MFQYIYIIPLVVLILTSIGVYKYRENDKNAKIQAVIAGIIAGIVVFFILKYKDGFKEPMMPGNYFDN